MGLDQCDANQDQTLFGRQPLDIKLPAELFFKRFGGKRIAGPRSYESFATLSTDAKGVFLVSVSQRDYREGNGKRETSSGKRLPWTDIAGLPSPSVSLVYVVNSLGILILFRDGRLPNLLSGSSFA
jgi:hypothetical protein